MGDAAKSVRAKPLEISPAVVELRKRLHETENNSQGDVIDNGESTSDQPAVKREVMSVPYPEIVELQQKLLKAEGMLQGAYRAVRTAELRAEEAEIRLDSKYGIKEGFNAEKSRADGLEIKLADALQENEALKEEMAELRQEHHDRIDELKGRLDQYQLQLLQQPPQPQPQSPSPQLMAQQLLQQQYPEEAAEVAPIFAKAMELHEIGHPTNIFQLCRPNFKGQSTPLGKAFGLLKSATMKGGKAQFLKRYSNMHNEMSLSCYCDLCDKRVNKFAVIEHFLYSGHYQKAKALGAAVSSAALKFWLNKLQPEKQQYQITAAAADAGGARSPKVVKKEEVDD
ncbi:hypothetical protein PENTCL1PPCAC_24174 [Pristionchus entomophagus]|uniref:Uncharacterized protein n=1 Tax=Pristionchus entomophagus TaxID=358040 RepID=A0AAV5U588_9BILA|nr:hypothetical protein PENTCL1PPCAC_24174 [Pristionchus entomophagus]